MAAPAAPAGFDQATAYVPLKSGELTAVSLEDGAVRWTVDLATPFTPATGDGLVFAATDDSVRALDENTGRLLWAARVGGVLSGPLHWESGRVLASTDAGELIAIDAQDGRVMWRTSLGAPLATAPTVSSDRLYAPLRDARVAALDLDRGATLWTTSVTGAITGLLALEEQVLVGTRANLLHSVSPDRGRIRWTQRAGADLVGAPIADGEHIYFVALDHVLRALDRRNGHIRWIRPLPSRPSGGPLRTENVVLVPFSTQSIGAYATATGAEAFTIRAVGELGGAPFLREHARATSTRLVAMSREGALQGFAARVEPPLAPLTELPGTRVGG
jgi:outer membrane protein assembly factor BamB